MKLSEILDFKSEASKKFISKNYKMLYLVIGAIGLVVTERLLFHNGYVQHLKVDEKANFIYYIVTLLFFSFCGLYIMFTIIGKTLSQDWNGDKLKLTRLTRRKDLY